YDGPNDVSVRFVGAGGSSTMVYFRPLGVGSTVVSVTAPAGFATPAAVSRQITFNVTQPGIRIDMSHFGRIGKNLQDYFFFALGGRVPAGGLTATASSSDPSR